MANFRKKKTGIFPYNRQAALAYAKKWALDRNPKYYDFEHLGGDCTNFASQVLHAGGCPMNYLKWTGWYYRNINNRAPAWTGVDYLYHFLMMEKENGPIGQIATIEEIEVGDIIQLNFENDDVFNHSPVVIDIKEPRTPENIYVAAHTYDRYHYRLSSYPYLDIRYIHILGYKRS